MCKSCAFIALVIASIIILSVILYLICYLVNKICDKLVVKWENKRLEMFKHPDEIMILENEEFKAFAEVAIQYGNMLSFEQANDKADRIIRCINAQTFDKEIKK